MVQAVTGSARPRFRERPEAQSRRAQSAQYQADQITYCYTSRLAGEPAAGVNDVHFHPVELLAVRFTWVKAF